MTVIEFTACLYSLVSRSEARLSGLQCIAALAKTMTIGTTFRGLRYGWWCRLLNEPLLR